MSIDPDRLRPLPLHGGSFADDFCAFAPAIRTELLAYRGWTEMTTNSGVRYERQTGISTGMIDQGTHPELVECHRFRALLLAEAATLFDMVGAAPRAIDGTRLVTNGMAYGQGGWLLPHTDEGPSTLERLSWILYLTDPADGEWSDRDGGMLRLSDVADAAAAGAPLVDLRPRFNRLALFRNHATSYHEVVRVARPTTWPTCRLALSGWMVAPVAPPALAPAPP